MKNAPKHIAIIPDGNRRWAKKMSFSQPWRGHQVGVKALEKILLKALELKISYFTFWGSSWDNITKRSKAEVDFLFKLYNKYFLEVAKDKRIHQNEVKINIFGRWKETLPRETQEALEKVMETTKDYNKNFLTFLLAYDGKDEMIDCVQRINNLNPKTKITPKLIKEHLWTKDLPPVDLVIRTGCKKDPHNSAGFMMWDTAYSQLYFTPTLFPDFGLEEFENIIRDYARRQRRLGK